MAGGRGARGLRLVLRRLSLHRLLEKLRIDWRIDLWLLELRGACVLAVLLVLVQVVREIGFARKWCGMRQVLVALPRMRSLLFE
jgi:hypothetical protein